MNLIKRPLFLLTDEQKEEIAKVVFTGFYANFESARISQKDITKLILQEGVNESGYDLAKELEYIASPLYIDTLIIEELDSIETYADQKKEELEKEWIKENKIKPLLEKGQSVFYFKHGEKRIINDINYTNGKYHLEIEAGNKNKSRIVNFEDVEKLNLPLVLENKKSTDVNSEAYTKKRENYHNYSFKEIDEAVKNKCFSESQLNKLTEIGVYKRFEEKKDLNMFQCDYVATFMYKNEKFKLTEVEVSEKENKTFFKEMILDATDSEKVCDYLSGMPLDKKYKITIEEMV